MAVVNGFVGNTWRIQTAKAFVEQPEIASQIEEFKAVSTGTDVAAQLGAIEDIINQGFDAIITIAVHSEFVGVVVQGGTTSAVRALLDADHPLVPIAGESENGFRKLLAEFGPKGLHGMSIGQSPGMVAIAIKAALAALDGNVMPQLISVPIPFATYDQLEVGTNYWPDLTDNFSTVNEFPPCDVNITAREIMAKDAD